MKKHVLWAATALVAAAIPIAYAVARLPQFAFAEQRTFINDMLKDPGSTQFRGERIAKSGALCGELNSKNGSGGYAGFKRFIAIDKKSAYLEGEGQLGEVSTSEMIAMLDQENAVIKEYIALRKQSSEIPIPSEYTLKEQARKRYFEKKWEDLCS